MSKRIIASPKASKKGWSTKKKIIVAIIIVVILASIATPVAIVLLNKNDPKKPKTSPDAEIEDSSYEDIQKVEVPIQLPTSQPSKSPIPSKTPIAVTDLFSAIEDGDPDKIKNYLTGGKLETKNSQGYTPLLWAAKNKQHEAAKLLLEKGANIEAVDSQGNTALILSAGLGDIQTANELIAKGANTEAANKAKVTPIGAAMSAYAYPLAINLSMKSKKTWWETFTDAFKPAVGKQIQEAVQKTTGLQIPDEYLESAFEEAQKHGQKFINEQFKK